MYGPLMIMAVPAWLVAYVLGSQFGYINPWIGAMVSLGITSSVYVHTIFVVSLDTKAHTIYEMLTVIYGKGPKALIEAIKAPLYSSLLPAVMVVFAECIADFGVANYYGLNTLTMLSYNVYSSTWNLHEIVPGLAMLAVLGIVTSMHKQRAHLAQPASGVNGNVVYALGALVVPITIVGWATITCARWVMLDGIPPMDDLAASTISTLLLITGVGLLGWLAVVLLIADILPRRLVKLSITLYAIPGIVLAVGGLFAGSFGVPMILCLVVVVSVRYVGLVLNIVDASSSLLARFNDVIVVYAKKGLHQTKLKLSVLLPSIGIGLCTLLLDCLRELPISMVLQPMNFQTIAMKMNYLAHSESITSLGAYGIILLGFGLMLCSVLIGLMYYVGNKQSSE